ncbi:unnamed protein product [Prunus armeniaca]|uniref:NAB domain-containing protein n=1 Tax=Prunus armeniaca TaxID=36596 RepID=A0A6J5UWV2_PRUAR|nr:unnamed protein product [Prunus armeniaca]
MLSAEIENNVTRIFKLIKNEEQGKKEDSRKDSKNESELVGLIENFYQQYQSLYALYDHLVGESGRIVRGKKREKVLPCLPPAQILNIIPQRTLKVTMPNWKMSIRSWQTALSMKLTLRIRE